MPGLPGVGAACAGVPARVVPVTVMARAATAATILRRTGELPPSGTHNPTNLIDNCEHLNQEL
ncbi:hypothetical protein GCM10027280_43700 [Micromonospora polyrhachis]